jgi:hypothetical protein
MERLLAAQNAGQGSDNFMLEFAKMQKKVRGAAAPACIERFAHLFSHARTLRSTRATL